MMEDRSATIGSLDRLNLGKIKQRQQKNDKLVQRKSPEMSSKKLCLKRCHQALFHVHQQHLTWTVSILMMMHQPAAEAHTRGK